MKQFSRLTIAVGLAAAGLAGSFSLIGGSSLFFHSSHPSGPADSVRLPRTMLWAWERPEDLRFLNSPATGVAFLARTIELRQQTATTSAESRRVSAREFWFPDPAANLGVNLRPRLQPLRVAREGPLMAVVRLETSNDLWHRPLQPQSASARDSLETEFYSDEQRQTVAAMIAAAARLPQVKALQIDFDASQSEQPFYGALLQDVRRLMPQGMPLSITALTSWCTGESWLDQLPAGTIDEAVPMLFRMGPDGLEVASYVKSGREFRTVVCRGSLGVSTDEDFSRAILSGVIGQRASAAKRIYVFSAKSWTKKDVSAVAAEVAKWHRD